MLYKIIKFVLAVTFILEKKHVLSQVCVETQMVLREVPETYNYTYLEAYEKSFCLFWCTDTRVATATGTRNVQKEVPENVNVCCEGYIKDDNSTDNSLHCKPLCSTECQNGYCKAPNECACNTGYILDSSQNCTPLCMHGCAHGTCIAPNNCQCDDGYEMYKGNCEPICNDTCINGACVAPNTCHCLPGYQKTDENTCEEYCTGYTDYGECIYASNCEPGWSKVMQGGYEICEPICSHLCINGYCAGPEHCECHHGYEYSTPDTCIPHCSSECLHGYCGSPENCVCDKGWYRSSEDVCLAHCDHICGNGTCVAPDVCECFEGYMLDEVNKVHGQALCKPICDDCDGTCVAPNQCVCEEPLEAKQVTEHGYDCGSVIWSKCVRTVCVAKTEDIGIDNDIEETLEQGSSSYAEQESGDGDKQFDGKIQTASWLRSKWFYGAISVILTGLVVLIAVLIMKKKYKSASKNISFDRDDAGIDNLAVHYKV